MKEQFGYQKESKIKWPQSKRIEVDPSVDFIYIMRKDNRFTLSSIAQRIASEHRVDEEKTGQIFNEEYDKFFCELTDILQWSFSSKENFELHLYNPDKLDKEAREKAKDTPIVSL